MTRGSRRLAVAKRFADRGVEMEELVQLGAIGLIKAVDKFASVEQDATVKRLCIKVCQ